MTPITYTFQQNTLAKNKHALATAHVNGTTYDFNHDLNGNLLSGPDFTDMSNIGTRRTTYNADNMPTTIYCTGTRNMVRYEYDGEGVRAKKLVRKTGEITYYVGKHFEVSGAGEITRYVFAGAIRVAMIKDGHTYYFHKDHLGSTTALTDATGTVVERIEYLPFGAMAYHDGERIAKHLYTDQEWEPETGFYHYSARLYDPILGRFITPDSLVPDPYDPQALNRYVYVKNNPLKHIDPTGHFFWDIIDYASWGHSAYTMFSEPFSWSNLGFLAWDTVSLLPAIPSSGSVKLGKAGLDFGKSVFKGFGKEGLENVVKASDNVASNSTVKKAVNTTRTGVKRNNPAQWRKWRNEWDNAGYGDALSVENRANIAKGKSPIVDGAWVKTFPEHSKYIGQKISPHHVGGSPLTVPLPKDAHLNAHMPGGFRYNPGGPGGF